MRDQAAWRRMLASMWAEFRTIHEPSGGRLLERDGVIASIVPAVPERSLPNSVVYEREDHLEAALPELATAYDDAGIYAWTVWVPERHRRACRLLERAGHHLDATPEAMIASLDRVEPPRPGDRLPDPHPRMEELAAVNDLAYGTGDSFARIIGSGPGDATHVYIAKQEGRPLSTVVTADHSGDCSVWWVATVPEARGRGLSAGLMRRALADGRERGCDVSTLQATRRGRPVYEALGYRPLGTLEMWERRRAGI